ncbi:putative ABC transport system permease protein [Arboricoccus pini]|uniref:Putative ABC transport system permease protein n=1 Tax=Arboricoccus pini TaxID=1963835 RepID=A0A212R5K2_9PROT|nr:iron export ABC transporter permease subunit FetB [Arboricoccus pini]SNB67201.1 putative ABC transport system permease protein [Arboricoccus pini]
MTPISLTPFDLAAASLLIVVDGLLSVVLGLGLHKQIVVAASRMVIQLLLVGYILKSVFALASPALTLAVLVVMALSAAREVAVRPERRLSRGGNLLIGTISVFVATSLTSMLALLTAIRPEPILDARYVIPLTGIIMGSVLNAASLSMDSLLDAAVQRAAAIEAQLCLGIRFKTAMGPLLRQALRRGMVPIINQMAAAGLVTLPGTMTGQILAGLDPVEAVKYQILLMFLLGGSSGIAALVTTLLTMRWLTDDRERLRLDRLKSHK